MKYILRFLPYLDTQTIIGYEPSWLKRGYGYGRWEELFLTKDGATNRMKFLIDSEAVEDIELLEITGTGMMTKTLSEWKAYDS